ncbi:MAG: YbjQ family protein [Candidatus Omnitrophica bacterium]|jgi:uncharacterized protein YbjQ (UPF0145 family)|nr:YbjQ family protein [Candidatus Omnitrophota bacterium]MDD5080575.1 YbjQ family protein [Candidatus Omnitrophota bacterium]MDD5441074.1 YbjQ family protein [Candidatus Omnitrophota bacterium]
MIFSNLDCVPGKTIVEHYGIVQGSTVRARNIGVDCLAGCKNTIGGEIKGYSELLEASRKESLYRMGQQAAALGANAVINVRYGTSAIAAGAAELLAYGTAVKVE